MKNKSQSPLVSVIIPVYNGERYLAQAIESVLSQTYKNIEIIIVDDGSTDSSKNIALSYGKKIKYLRKENGGVSSALNFGIKTMHGEYFSWLSCDDIYLPNKIEDEINILQENKVPDCVVFSNYYLINSKGETIDTTHFEKQAIREQLCSGIYPVIYGMVNGDSILIPKKAFSICGLFDESLRTTGDYDFWVKLFRHFPSCFVESPLIKYRIHENQDSQKSPVYISESDTLWCLIIDGISKQDIKQWKATPFQIYMDLYRNMKLSNFNKAADLAFSIAQKYINEKRTISVLMPAYNSEKYIKKAINSSLFSSFGDFELIIIDDGSTDSTLRIAKKIAEKDPRIKIIANKVNKGVASSMNQGLKIATGKYITRLDSDDIDGVNRLRLEYIFLESSPKYDFCTTNMNLTNELGNLTCQKSYPMLYAPATFAAAFTHPIPSAPIMYRASIIRDNNLSYKKYSVAEDYDFMLSYLNYGEGAMLEDAEYNYRIHDDSLYHNNLDLALTKGRELCEQYADSISQNLSNKTLFKLVSDFIQEENIFTEENIFNATHQINDIIASFKEKYNYSETEVENCHHFIISSLMRRYANNIQNNNTEYLPIYRRIIRSIRVEGVSKTVKKAFKKILKRERNGK